MGNEGSIERKVDEKRAATIYQNDVLKNLAMIEKLAKQSQLCKENAVFGALEYFLEKAMEAKFPAFPLTRSSTLHPEYILEGIKKWTAERIGKRSQPCEAELPEYTKVIKVSRQYRRFGY